MMVTKTLYQNQIDEIVSTLTLIFQNIEGIYLTIIESVRTTVTTVQQSCMFTFVTQTHKTTLYFVRF